MEPEVLRPLAVLALGVAAEGVVRADGGGATGNFARVFGRAPSAPGFAQALPAGRDRFALLDLVALTKVPRLAVKVLEGALLGPSVAGVVVRAVPAVRDAEAGPAVPPRDVDLARLGGLHDGGKRQGLRGGGQGGRVRLWDEGRGGKDCPGGRCRCGPTVDHGFGLLGLDT